MPSSLRPVPGQIEAQYLAALCGGVFGEQPDRGVRLARKISVDGDDDLLLPLAPEGGGKGADGKFRLDQLHSKILRSARLRA